MRVIVGLFFLFAVFACVLPGRADPLPTADEIKAKADAFRGPEPANYRETIVGTGTDGDVKEVTYRNGDDVRHTSDRGGIHLERGTFHGETWNLEENGLVVVNVKDPGLAAPDKRTITVRRVTTPVDAFVVSDLNARSEGRRTYYDPITFREIRSDQVGPEGTTTTTFDDPTTFGARTLPRRWTVVSAAANRHMQYERTEYVANAVTAADVQEPATQRQVVTFPPGVTSADLPVRFINNNVYVRVNVGARAVDFLLDTGASAIFVDTDLARQIGLTLVNASSEVTAGRYTGYDAIVPDIAIGSLHMRDVVAHVVPMPAIHAADAKEVGLLGFDFLAQLGVTIDYEHQTVRVVPASSFTAPVDPTTYAFEVRVGEGVPMTTVKVSGFTAERVFFDTGGSTELMFFDYFARRYPNAFSAGDDLGAMHGYGVGGAFSAEFFQLHEVQLGPIHFRNFVAARVPPSASYNYDADGMIGNELLSKFIVSLDYTDGMVYLTPTDDTKRAMHPLK